MRHAARLATVLGGCALGLGCLPMELVEVVPQLSALAAAPPGEVSIELLRGFEAPPAPAPPASDERVALVVDVTTSMAAPAIAGVPRAEAARRAAARLVNALPPSTSLGLFALGGRSGECRAPQALGASPADAPRGDLLEAIADLRTRGEGSLATSLDLVTEGLAPEPSSERVVVFTDLGGECGGDLCEAVSDLLGRGARLDLVIFGDVAPPGCVESLVLDPDPAGAGEPPGAPEFRVEARGGSFGHSVLARGRADGAPIEVPAGTAHLVLELEPPAEIGPIFLPSGARTRVRVLEFPNLGRGVVEWRWEVSAIDGQEPDR